MKNKLERYIDYIFDSAPKTKEALDLKEEILADISEKYNDLISEGKSEDEAYNIAVSGLGDLNELIGKLKSHSSAPQYTQEQIIRDRKRSAVFTSTAVALYILSPVFFLFFEEVIGEEFLGIMAMFVLIATATVLLIYNNMTKLPNIKQDDSVVEEFKEWKYQTDSRYQFMKAINSAIGTLTVVIYFVVSFTTFAWHITWIIFLIGSALKSIVKSVFELTR